MIILLQRLRTYWYLLVHILLMLPTVGYGAAKPQGIPVCNEAQPSCRDGPLSGVCLHRFAGVLPPALFKDLQETVLANPLKGLHWASRGSNPQNIYERAGFHIAKVLSLGPGEFSSFEYWMKVGLPEDNWHFDSQEEWDHCAAFPYMSTILYMDDKGPPTLLHSKTLSDVPFNDPKAGPANDTTYLSWPSANHVLAFSGDLFHGIHDVGRSLAPTTKKRRIILFNFWKHDVEGAPDAAPKSGDDSSCEADAALAEPVPLRSMGKAVGKDFASVGEESFGKAIAFNITYRLHDDALLCTVQKKSWQRHCAEGADSPLISVENSMRSIKVLRAPKGFTGGLAFKNLNRRP